MTVSQFNKVIGFKDKYTLVKGLLILKLLERDLILPDNDVNILTLFVFNQNKEEVLEQALNKEYVRSIASGDNKVSDLVKLKLLKKIGLKKRKIDEDIFDTIDSDYIAANYKIHNLGKN